MQSHSADLLPSDLDQLCINTIRFLSVDAVQKANSGHPGLPLGAAPMAYLLWSRFLRHNPRNPAWFNRDRFVLSGGHGSMLLYSLLHLTGYDLSLDDLKNFRQLGSRTPGHPERGRTAGVEVSTGPLGQGFANSVGMAIAEAHLAARYNRPGFDIIEHYSYGIASDGDLMEGVASEAASLAGHLKLGKLIYFYDDNRISLASSTDLTFTESRARRFEAYGWQVLVVDDANELMMLEKTLEAARRETTRPSLIIVRSHIGFGSPNKQDTFEAHGSPLGADEVRLTKERLGWPVDPPFLVPPEAQQHFRKAVDRGAELEKSWEELFERYSREYPDLAKELRDTITGKIPGDLSGSLPNFPADPKGMATRIASGKVLNALAAKVPNLLGGSADLNPSTFTALQGLGDLEAPGFAPKDRQGAVGGEWGYGGRNVHYGVREHAMGAISNGIAAHGGLIPYDATFLTFSDYMRPTLRLGALSELQVIHIYTHDSIALGEDGPTHQPVEHVASLRAIPHVVVLRPGDANETAVAWLLALERKAGPTALILSRQNVPTLDRARYAGAEGVRHGAYIISEAPEGKPQIILIGTGSELPLVLGVQDKLLERGVRARVVSMPSWELFEKQPPEYRRGVLPPEITARLAVEAGSPMGWQRYVGDHGDVLGVLDFGTSAPGTAALEAYGFTVENVCKRAFALIGMAGEGA
ncbi:transketolase [Geomonas sp. RF6]|uniref:transketolase n=1 Tax=Geomonas sp. RF6 TaxID=2897342 RepID=UPI001E515D25|nr:transketolase [Geomonas sp. RF6]UFS69937.1 transketolase [Geomonas sp. RF6]